MASGNIEGIPVFCEGRKHRTDKIDMTTRIPYFDIFSYPNDRQSEGRSVSPSMKSKNTYKNFPDRDLKKFNFLLLGWKG
jgi:hypothetical protein